ncbi:MAG TPA: beta-(1-6) glucans synthase [Pseudolabrys sp.]|nr:beta-(1-6) glucans synthase [Pseudolabrys sp.]
MGKALALFVLSSAVIAATWAWLGAPVTMPNAPLAPGDKLYCVSYAPFRPNQTPFDPATHVSSAQIGEDFALLAKLTGCVRTYSVELGLDQVPEIAREHGLKVILGIWLSGTPEKNRLEIETGVDLANRYPDVVQAVVVGNEVLLRGEMSAADLASTIRAVKARVHVPVTYADVWEFWLRNEPLAAAVDFVTIHILPYWEDFPIAAGEAAAHVAAIRRKVADAFPGKDVLIGEVGWPSAGRMREGALPSPANQARVIQDVLAYARRESVRVNVIEAFDQPWKRALEGTVGGHWGLFDAYSRHRKFEWGAAVSNHPYWIWQAAGGVLFSFVIFSAALAARRGREPPLRVWATVTAIAIAGGIMIGWTAANVPLESYAIGGWVRSVAFASLAAVAPPIMAAALTAGVAIPRFSEVVGPAPMRIGDPLARLAGAIVMALTVMAVQSALGLVFDPRYKDFPFAPLAAAALPVVLLALTTAGRKGARGAAEIAAAGVLALSIVYIVPNEGFANWQSLWFCVGLAALALTLVRVRGAQG